MNTNKNIKYPPTLPPKYPSTSVMNRYTAAPASTVYVRTQQSIEYLKINTEQKQQSQKHRELSMITSTQQHPQCQCPINTNI